MLQTALWADPVTNEPVHSVCVKAIGNGQKPVHVAGAGLDVQDGSGATFVLARLRPPSTIPETLQPQHSLEAFFPILILRDHGFDLTRPLTGFVNLAIGKTVRSEPKTLRR